MGWDVLWPTQRQVLVDWLPACESNRWESWIHRGLSRGTAREQVAYLWVLGEAPGLGSESHLVLIVLQHFAVERTVQPWVCVCVCARTVFKSP